MGKGSKKMRMITIHGSKTLGDQDGMALRLAVSAALRASPRNRMAARFERVERMPIERRSVERAALAVEAQFVKGIWVIQRATSSDGPRASQRCGLDYLAERADLSGYTDAAGGKWESTAPRPALPSSKEIDAATESQNWLQFLDPLEARVLAVGALSKCGDAGRNINWNRVRSRLPELHGYTVRSLQGIYHRALRNIVAELTAEKIVVI